MNRNRHQLQRATSENIPTLKEELLQKKNVKTAAGVILFLIVLGGVTGAIVLAHDTGITNVFYFI